MPVLRRKVDGSGWYARAYVPDAGGYATWQVTGKGAQILDSRGIGDGDAFSVDDLVRLIELGEANTGGAGVTQTPGPDPFDGSLPGDPVTPLVKSEVAPRPQPSRLDRLELVQEMVLKGHEWDVQSLTFVPGQQRLCSGNWYDELKVWDLQQRGDDFDLTAEGYYDWISNLAVDPQGRWLATAGAGGRVIRWDLQRRQLSDIWEDRRMDQFQATAIAPSGLIAAVDCDFSVWLCRVSPRRGRQQRLLPAQGGRATTVAFHPTKPLVCIGDLDGRVSMSPLRGLREANSFLDLGDRDNAIQHVYFSPDGNTLAVSDNATIWFWDTVRKRLRSTIQLPESMRDMTFVGANRIAAVLSDRSLRIWDVEKGLELAKKSARQFSPLCIAYSEELSLLASGGDKKKPHIWIWSVRG